jgi:hypothetical protein
LTTLRICVTNIQSLSGHFQVVPSIAIAFVTYEIVKDVLGVEMRISD